MVILFRRDNSNEEEFAAAQKYFRVETQRSQIKDSLVIPRYSSLPFYLEFERDLSYNNSRLVQPSYQHRYVTNFDYYADIQNFTPQTWTDLSQCPHDGPFVVKGRTNSRKRQWKSLMYAENKRQAAYIGAELMQDDLIFAQGVIYREFIPLKVLEESFTGCHFTNEWRFFLLGDQIISHGYYWSGIDDLSLPSMNDKGINLVKKVADIVKYNTTFYVIDIAEKEDGEWIVIELNCGTMSGLSMIDPDQFYRSLLDCLSSGKFYQNHLVTS